MTAQPTDIRQVSVSRVTLGVIISTAVLAGCISWSSSRLVSRLDAVEATVENLAEELDGLQDSVGFLLMGDEQSFWEAP